MGRRRQRRRTSRRRLSTIVQQDTPVTAGQATPAGSDNQLQFNNNGTLGGVAALTFDDTDLKITDDVKLRFGTNDDAHIEYDENGVNFLIISGSSNGIIMSGAAVHVDQKLGIGMPISNITHGITLPDNADNTGKVKANAYMTYSSQRFKKDVEVIDNPIKTIQNLRGVTFTWKKNDQKDYGFIAEEVGKELPIIVEWDRNNSENSPQAMSMDYTRIIPILLEGIKFQQNQIDNLIDEIKCLKQGTEPT